jgi:general secretion pathway protein C
MELPKRLSSLSGIVAGLRSDSWQTALPFWVAAALVLLVAWQLVQLLWSALGAAPQLHSASPGATSPRSAGPAISIDAIVNAHLFGLASAPPNADPSAAPATQMNLVLVGTIASSDPEKGVAIVGESPATAKVYTVGKTVTGGTRLHSVYTDYVILDRGGTLEKLLLPKKFTGGGTPGAMAARPPATTGAPPMLGDRLRTLASQNPSAITDILRPQPVFANGQQRGYRVYPGRNRQQFAKLGLMPGDLVTSINGTPLDDPSRGMEILQSMNSASEITVTLERNGQTAQVSINNAQVAADAAAAAAAPPESYPVTEVEPTSGDEATQ